MIDIDNVDSHELAKELLSRISVYGLDENLCQNDLQIVITTIREILHDWKYDDLYK